MNATQEFRKVGEIVEEVLRNDYRSRRDDKWLVYKVWQKVLGGKIYIPFDKFAILPYPETISRTRRKFQNDKKMYRAEDYIEKKREEKQVEVRQWAISH